LEGAGVDATNDLCILALSDQTYVLRSPVTTSANSERRHGGLETRELVWPWNTPLSSVLQFAASFSHAAMPNGLACVVNGQFHMADLDPSRAEPSTSKPTLLGGTPRRIVHHAPSNSLAIITLDYTVAGAQSKLLLLDPLSCEVRTVHEFGSTGGDAAHSLCILPRKDSGELIVVGTAAPKQ